MHVVLMLGSYTRVVSFVSRCCQGVMSVSHFIRHSIYNIVGTVVFEESKLPFLQKRKIMPIKLNSFAAETIKFKRPNCSLCVGQQYQIPRTINIQNGSMCMTVVSNCQGNYYPKWINVQDSIKLPWQLLPKMNQCVGQYQISRQIILQNGSVS